MVARGYDAEFAQRCFNQIKGFGEYGFPESHAASFAHLVYVSAWIKCHYPAAFAAALLNSQPMGFYAPAQIVRDAREHGVEVRAADVNLSDWDCTLEARRDANGSGARPCGSACARSTACRRRRSRSSSPRSPLPMILGCGRGGCDADPGSADAATRPRRPGAVAARRGSATCAICDARRRARR